MASVNCIYKSGVLLHYWSSSWSSDGMGVQLGRYGMLLPRMLCSNTRTFFKLVADN